MTRLRAWLPMLTAGLVLGVVEVVFVASFMSLIFSGSLAVHASAGLGLGLFGAVAIMTTVALFSTEPGTQSTVQDVPATILAAAAAAIAARLPGGSPEAFLAVVLVIACASVLAGAALLALGTFRLGNLVRYVPYPVVGGFLGGTGVLLVLGSLEVLTGRAVALTDPGILLEGHLAARWLPGIAAAVLLVVIARRASHALAIPAALLAVVLAFYAVVLASGTGVAGASAGGWLLGPFPAGTLWQPWIVTAVTGADWALVAGQAAQIGSLVVFTALALLINASGAELVLGRDVDLDRDLRAAGVGNIVGGLGGAPPGYHALSLTVLAIQVSGRNRVAGLVAAGVCAVALLAGASALSLLPRVLVGGLVAFVGLGLVIEWAVETRSRLPRGDYVLLVLIVVVIAVWGFVPGVVAGLAAAVLLFLINYSRIDVVKHALSASSYQSNVDRPDADREYLREHGDGVAILALQGYLFFGTSNSLFERVRSRVTDRRQAPVRYLVLDFNRVTCLDSSAVQSFAKTCALAEAEGFTVVLAGAGPAVRRILSDAGMSEGQHPSLREFPDLDRGVQWCEDRMLAERDGEPATALDGGFPGLDTGRLPPFLERLDLPAGHVLIRQGEPPDALYLLASGRLTAEVARDHGQPVRLRTVAAGAVVGELGLYLGAPRTATVTSETACTVLRLSREALDRMERQDPEAAAALHRGLARLMAQRIADDVRTITALLD